MFEHFYDLCYVVVLAELVDYLTDNTVNGAITVFVALFVPAWLLWTGTTYFTIRFGVDDTLERLLIGSQLIAVAGMALSIHGGLDIAGPTFAISYAAGRLLVAALYLKARAEFVEYRKFIGTYITANLLATAFWLASAFVPSPARFALWGVGMLCTVALPVLTRSSSSPDFHRLASVPERFRVFSVIVLSEAVKNTIDGMSQHPVSLFVAISGVLAFVVACSLWWIYFDNVDGRFIRPDRLSWSIWANTHLPLLGAFAAASAGAEQLVESNPDGQLSPRTVWLLAGSIAICLFGIAAIHLLTGTSRRARDLALVRSASAVAAIVIAIWGVGLRPIWVIALLAATCVAQVVYDVVTNKTVSVDVASTT